MAAEDVEEDVEEGEEGGCCVWSFGFYSMSIDDLGGRYGGWRGGREGGRGYVHVYRVEEVLALVSLEVD